MTQDQLAVNLLNKLIKECKKEIASGILQESVDPKAKEVSESEELSRFVTKQVVATLKQVS